MLRTEIKKFVLESGVLLFKVLLGVIRVFQRMASPTTASHLQNIFLFFCGSPVRHGYDKKKKLYIAKQQGLIRYYGEKDRGFRFYAPSIVARGELLSNSYCLESVIFEKDDVVVDCGANYGDLYIHLADKVAEKNYIAIEPSPIEYKCLINSLPNARILNLGLSDQDGVLDFYVCSNLGDSSIVEPPNYTNVVKVKVRRMDSVASSLNIEKCKLFKLEAEGWELEILQGAREFIRICKYIAVDGGPERGVDAQPTFHALNNFLLKHGFEMISINGPDYRALYRNLSL